MLKYNLLQPAEGPCPEPTAPRGNWINVSTRIEWQKRNEWLIPNGAPKNTLPLGVRSNGIKIEMLPVALQAFVNSKPNYTTVAQSVSAGGVGFTLVFGEVWAY